MVIASLAMGFTRITEAHNVASKPCMRIRKHLSVIAVNHYVASNHDSRDLQSALYLLINNVIRECYVFNALRVSAPLED